MFCQKCGKENPDGSKFCKECGTRIGETLSLDNSSDAKVKVVEGILGAAWNDIKSTPGWFKRVLLLAVLNAIPFLNYGVTGYTQQWGKEIAKGKREIMPKQIFSNKTFLSGLFEYVVFAAYGAVLFVASLILLALLGWVPVVGVIIPISIIVFTWFWNGYVSLSAMRTTVTMDLGRGFDTKKLFASFKKNVGGIFVAYFIPSLLCGIICLLIISIFIAIFAGGVFAAFSSFVPAMGYGVPAAAVNNLGGVIAGLFATGGITLVLVIIFCVFVCFFMSGFEKLLRYRALGHWISRYASEWNKEAKKNELNN